MGSVLCFSLSNKIATLVKAFNTDTAFLLGASHFQSFDKFGVLIGKRVGFGEYFVVLDF